MLDTENRPNTPDARSNCLTPDSTQTNSMFFRPITPQNQALTPTNVSRLTPIPDDRSLTPTSTDKLTPNNVKAKAFFA